MTMTALTDRIDDLVLAAAVRSELAAADTAGRLAARLDARQHTLRDDGERGAQAAEYAMLGGVAAAGCGTMVVVLNSQQDTLGGLVSEWLGRVFDFASSWLGS